MISLLLNLFGVQCKLQELFTIGSENLAKGASPLALQFINERRIPSKEAAYFSLADKFYFKGFSDDILSRFSDIIFDRLVFPFRLLDSSIVGFGSRSLDGSAPKFRQCSIHDSIKSIDLVYGLHLLDHFIPNSPLYLVEGVSDLFALRSLGCSAICIFGTYISFTQAMQIALLSTDINLCFDGDDAGRDGVHKAACQLANFNIIPKVVCLPEGLDPDDAIRSGLITIPILISIVDFLKLYFTKIKFLRYLSLFSSPSIVSSLSSAYQISPIQAK